jgi:hypothetical protein
MLKDMTNGAQMDVLILISLPRFSISMIVSFTKTSTQKVDCVDTWKAGSGGHFKSHDHKEQEEVRDVNDMPQIDTRHNVAQTHGILGQTVRNVIYENKEYQERYPIESMV